MSVNSCNMEEFNICLKEAIDGYYSESGEGLDIFDYNADVILEECNTKPALIINTTHPYALGLCFMILSGKYIDCNSISLMCAENAYYCFAKVLRDRYNLERIPVAMRFFLYLNDMERILNDICTFILMDNHEELSSERFAELKVANPSYVFARQIKAYCYSIFSGKQNNYDLLGFELERLNTYIELAQTGKYPYTKEFGDNTEYYINLLYSYLEKRIKSR